jgi:TolB-like protein/Flp pilus assembly protein TadD
VHVLAYDPAAAEGIPMADGSGFFAELQRRHVWRVAVAYAIVAWLLLQIASIVLPTFDAPAWAMKVLVLLFVILFPVALILAWAFEMTPEGVRRTEPADSAHARATHVTRNVGRKLDGVIIAVLVLAVILLLGNQFVWHAGEATTHAAPSMKAAMKAPASGAVPEPAVDIPAKSVAVLPFANEGGKADQQFFSDGLSEDLINALSQFAGLKVISRNSAFQFRDSHDSSKAIGEQLGVAHLLEGSVQRLGDKVRITATLVNAMDGSVLWSHRYDKPYTDLFALQDAITQAVAGALQAKLLTAPGAVLQSDRPPGGSLEAYLAYRHGIASFDLDTEVGIRQAITEFGKAAHVDPRYAAAYAQLSMAWVGLSTQFLTDAHAVAQAHAKARAASATALTLDPDSAVAHQARMMLLLNLDMDWRGAEVEARRTLQLVPNDPGAKSSLGNALATLGQNRRAVELARQALLADPRNTNWYQWLSIYLDALGQPDAGREAILTAIALQPGASASHDQLAFTEVLRGDAAAALTAARQEPPGPWHDIALAMALQIGSDHKVADAALKNLIAKYADGAPYQIAELYALRRDPDATFQWLDRAWSDHDPGLSMLLHDPFVLRFQHDPRFAAFCRKIGLPTIVSRRVV